MSAVNPARPERAAPLRIDVVSDVVCPWCFIGKRRLEKALGLRPDIAVEVFYRPYFLNPWIPPEGIDRKTYLERKFGSVDRYTAIAARVAMAAASEGLVYALDKISRQPNTLDCHRLIHWARNTGDPGRMKQRLMELYFSEGGDLTDPAVLIKAAADCGLEPALVGQLLKSDADVASIEQDANAAKEAGIEGVPCFIFGSALAVSGAQSPEYLVEAMVRVVNQQPTSAD